MDKSNEKLHISDVIYSRFLERIEKEDREIKVMLDLWYMATDGKDVILCVGNDCI